MKSTIQRALLAVAVAALGAGAMGAASAQSAGSAPAAFAGHPFHRGHFRRFGESPLVGSLLRATRQLGLTPAEQTSIKSILSSARPTHQPGAAPQGPGITVLGNPGDPNYLAAVQSAEANATAQIQKESVIAGQIYAALTPEHQKALPGVLASMQAKEEARRAAWASKRATGNG
jgi:hypothetical protein